MKKIILIIIILTSYSYIFSQNKPSIAPSLAIFGKLLDYKVEVGKSYFKILTAFVNGHKTESIVELYTNTSDNNIELNQSYYFLFSYSKYESNLWDLQIIDGGYEKYKSNINIARNYDIKIDGKRETRLQIGWNMVYLIITNNGNKYANIRFDKIKLLNSQAYGRYNSGLYMKINERIKNSEIDNYKINLDKKEITIPPYLKYIMELDIYIDKNYNIEKEFYVYKDFHRKKIDTLKTIREELIVWGSVELIDEMGKAYNIFRSKCETLLKNVVICSNKNDNCSKRNNSLF